MRVMFVFIDGFGIGEEDSLKNPLCLSEAKNISDILNSRYVFQTDPSLGVPGLPQSATGQTAIFTGRNAPAVLGRHLSGRPTVTLKKMIYEDNIFKRLISMGYTATNANVYTNQYLEMMKDTKSREHRPSVTSVMCMVNGIGFRTVDDYIAGNGIYHDIEGKILRERGYDVEFISPAEAAERFYNISRSSDFSIFEYFMTDITGHKGDMEAAVKQIELIDAFLGSLLSRVDLDEDVVIIASDHGNIEDMSVKTHTLNKVPTVILTSRDLEGMFEIKDLTDIMPAVVDIFKKWGGKQG